MNHYLNTLTYSDDLSEIMEDCQYTQNTTFGSGVGSNLRGVLENSITNPGPGTTAAFSIPSELESDSFPRSLINFAAIVNDQYCTNVSGLAN